MNDIPWTCHSCGRETMINPDKLERWPQDRIIFVRGFRCRNCGAREAVSYTNSSLDEIMRKMVRYSPHDNQFHALLARALQKSEDLHQRGEIHGESKRQNMAPP